jgi:hypothetical protein
VNGATQRPDSFTSGETDVNDLENYLFDTFAAAIREWPEELEDIDALASDRSGPRSTQAMRQATGRGW